MTTNDVATDDTPLDFSDEILAPLWQEFAATQQPYTLDSLRVRSAFVELVRVKLTDPDMADQIEWCDHCGRPGDNDGYSTVQGDGARACETCVDDHYNSCESCDELSCETTTTLYDTEVCERCCDNYYSWCEDCEGHYANDDRSDHDHNNCGCESPNMLFSVRNDGDGPLDNDTRVTITLPAGVIDDMGLQLIRRHLYNNELYDISTLVPEIGPEWQTKKGNFAKRLSRTAYNTYKQAISPEVLSAIGCIAREHSNSVDFEIETTRDLNMSAEDFYHEESCWWQSYSESRCALKSNGGFGLRTFGENGEVTGRAWVMPLAGDSLSPTFETRTPNAFIVFNGYGALESWAPARIMSHMTGWTYRKIDFGCSPMYVNAGGYLIAPEEIASKYNDGNCLNLSVDMHSNLFATEQANSKTERVLTYA